MRASRLAPHLLSHCFYAVDFTSTAATGLALVYTERNSGFLASWFAWSVQATLKKREKKQEKKIHKMEWVDKRENNTAQLQPLRHQKCRPTAHQHHLRLTWFPHTRLVTRAFELTQCSVSGLCVAKQQQQALREREYVAHRVHYKGLSQGGTGLVVKKTKHIAYHITIFPKWIPHVVVHCKTGDAEHRCNLEN